MRIRAYCRRPAAAAAIFLAALAGAFPACGASTDAWWDAGWSFRNPLIFEAAGIDAPLEYFPALVRLTPANFDFGAAQSGGADIRFIGAGGKLLPHEIERWDPVAGAAEIWFSVPRIPGAERSAPARMYYGNPAARDVQNPAKVWDDGFLGVWHFNAGVGDYGRLDDSTGKQRHAVWHDPGARGAAGAPGKIGGALRLHGYEDGPPGPVALVAWDSPWQRHREQEWNGSMTVEAWIKPAAPSGTVFDRPGWRAVGHWNQCLIKQGRPVAMSSRFSNIGLESALWGNTVLATNAWHHVVWQWGRGGRRIYVNGALDARDTFSGVGRHHPWAPLWIGAPFDGLCEHHNQRHIRFAGKFQGYIDEMRLSTAPDLALNRSAEWIKAAYLTMTGDAFPEIGPRESAPSRGSNR